MKRIKLFILLALLCSTFFLRGCGEHYYTFSFGFVLPYFDIIAHDSGEFDLSYTYNIFLSVIVNLIFVVACTIFIFKLDFMKRRKVLSKIYILLLMNIIIFDICILYSYSAVIEWVLLYYILCPILYITTFLEKTPKIPPNWNVLSRIYFLIATGIIYLIVSLFARLGERWLRVTEAKQLQRKNASS